ncbi:hypothetical protein [Pseudomonas aeruginosa]|uniref:hypothetical protein n=1 Tax=Pseudomonas aeruginosa TaxID=287 RepID=UPI001D761587|nr:hypothetical protein [Pseudomonas aeruginosa]MBX5836840.1 hypothetical protein [Pseudomonas aeruginosa]MBX6060978.1 hypothetical protein [Pseudomonas aeruginosa]MBX6135927.1 hypothetical protein [Pseudomonas aeruginosa]MBX6155774.1 hypothetical protein [Pseudomonas aeruginosa]
MTKANECTCPSGDGSLRHPCPAHPASVEQAGGDERDLQGAQGKRDGWGPLPIVHVPWNVFDRAVMWVEDRRRYGDDGTIVDDWKALKTIQRAALAQPSPAQTQPSPAPTLRAAIDVANDRFEVPVAKWGTDLVGEEERPEVAEVAFVLRNIGAMDAEDIDGDNVDLRVEDAEGRDTGCDVSIVEYAEKAADLFEQHDRIVGELRADRDSWAEQAEQRLADWDEMRKERDAALAEVKRIKTISDNYYALCVERQQQLDAALAMVSGLRSLLNPILCYVENDIERMRGDRDKSDNKETYDLAISLAMKRLKAAQHAVFTTEPGCNTAVELASHITAQAQHSVPEGVTIERDVAGTIHIKVGDFDFIQLQYQRPYTDNASTWKLAERIASLLAAAPGKEVGHE